MLESDAPYWIYRYDRPERPGRWARILPADGAAAGAPLPRFAHQVVYDPATRTAYMHGGNACLEPPPEDAPPRVSSVRATSGGAARGASEERIENVEAARGSDRLDDFWKLALVR